jgi:phosphoglycolate phosphatase
VLTTSGERCAVYDLDGTLTNPELGIVRCVEHTMLELGLDVPAPALVRACIGPPLREAFIMLGVPDSRAEEAVATYRDRYGETGLFENELIEGITIGLDELLESGVRLAVATSKIEQYAQRILEHFEIADRFEAVAGVSFDGHRTEKADVVADCLMRLGSPEPARTVLIGDRRHDVEGARKSGIACIGVTWGFAAPGELERAGAARVVDNPSELPAAVWSLLGR